MERKERTMKVVSIESLEIKLTEEEDVPNRVIVRLRTTAWYDGKSLHVKKSLTFLRRKCSGFNFLEEDLSCAGATDVLPMLTNLDSCEDGIYEIIHRNISRDWESGIVDGWDYKLGPFVEGEDDDTD
jgi:hypothetical protein